MGMTDMQYKGMLIDELNYWKECLELARKYDSNEAVIRHIENQIARINDKIMA